LGMARTGSTGGGGSGDYVIAFSTTRGVAGSRGSAVANATPESGAGAAVPEGQLSPLFEAVVDATEEAIYNSLLRATTVRGIEGHTGEAIPIERLRGLLAKRE
ncbi:MAG: P1 family peptidase, partial [Candidatus Acidiferrales bacterium]